MTSAEVAVASSPSVFLTDDSLTLMKGLKVSSAAMVDGTVGFP